MVADFKSHIVSTLDFSFVGSINAASPIEEGGMLSGCGKGILNADGSYEVL